MDRALGNVIGAADTSRHMFFATICSVALPPHVRDKLKQEQQQVRSRGAAGRARRGLSVQIRAQARRSIERENAWKRFMANHSDAASYFLTRRLRRVNNSRLCYPPSWYYLTATPQAVNHSQPHFQRASSSYGLCSSPSLALAHGQPFALP